jgi:hypothetical protein
MQPLLQALQEVNATFDTCHISLFYNYDVIFITLCDYTTKDSLNNRIEEWLNLGKTIILSGSNGCRNAEGVNEVYFLNFLVGKYGLRVNSEDPYVTKIAKVKSKNLIAKGIKSFNTFRASSIVINDKSKWESIAATEDGNIMVLHQNPTTKGRLIVTTLSDSFLYGMCRYDYELSLLKMMKNIVLTVNK